MESLKGEKQMNVNKITCASTDKNAAWDNINWSKAEVYVKRLQMRIVKAQKEGKYNKVKSLQWLLTTSFYAKALAVKRVTSNKGKRTSGVDGVLWNTSKSKFEAIRQMKRKGYTAKPAKRTYIQKANSTKKRPLGIPTMSDRAMQTLYKFALEPIAETTGDYNSYGFRPERCTQDAIEQCFNCLSRKCSAQWVLEGDIKGCFDNFSHQWIMEHIPMDKIILQKFLKSGYVEAKNLFPTELGAPQGSPCSPVISNLVLDGIEGLLSDKFKSKHKVNFIRYADDFIVTGITKELLEEEVKPIIEKYLQARGLELSQSKTLITHINDGFDFLGCNIRKYKDKLLIKPSKNNIEKFLLNIREAIRNNRASKQEDLIRQLNPKIIGWCNYHRFNVSKKSFSYIDNQIWNSLYKWAIRRHPRKGVRWIVNKYFHFHRNRNWSFSCDTNTGYIELKHAADTKIKRFTKVASKKNPFDENDLSYFVKRSKNKVRKDVPSTLPLITEIESVV